MKLYWTLLISVALASLVSVPNSIAVEVEGVVDPSPTLRTDTTASTTAESASEKTPTQDEVPWDFSPYRVLVWMVSDDRRGSAESIEASLRAFLDRDFRAAWRVSIADAPPAVRAAAFRDIDAMTYDMLTAADPVLAIKRDHREAVRIRVAANVGEFVKTIYGTETGIKDLLQRGKDIGKEGVDGVGNRLKPVDGDALKVSELWKDAETEAVLVSRGMAMTLDQPVAKLVVPPVAGLVSEVVEGYDKIFIVRANVEDVSGQIDVVELDTLMRFFGPVANMPVAVNQPFGETIGHAIIKAFAPVVRIDDAGQRNATGLLRAAGLIVAEKSPALVQAGDVLQPFTRKDDRNGDPFVIGVLDWAYLLVTEYADHNAKMEFYAGRSGGLQGRKNNRTFRTALKVRPFDDSTMLRLHAQGNQNFPLIGYEIYEKELKSTSMTFIGRTDWNGRLNIPRSDDPLRLMYVKNGGAVLARLPMTPGLDPTAVADLQGDDLRLQAESYIRGVQDAIIDLVAVRELYKARIRMRLERGEMEQAEELMESLRNQPSNEKLAGDMGKRQAVFLKLLGSRNGNQKNKVDEMFTNTRELLSKHINPTLVRELESDLITARKNGGKLPKAKPVEDPAE